MHVQDRFDAQQVPKTGDKLIDATRAYQKTWPDIIDQT